MTRLRSNDTIDLGESPNVSEDLHKLFSEPAVPETLTSFIPLNESFPLLVSSFKLLDLGKGSGKSLTTLCEEIIVFFSSMTWVTLRGRKTVE